MEDIADADHRHANKVFEKFKLKFMFTVIHYCLQMYLKILETNVSEYMN